MRRLDDGRRRYPSPVSASAGVMLDGWPSTLTGPTRGVGPWADQPSDARMSCDRVACRHEAGSFVPRTNWRLPATVDLPPRGRHCGRGLGNRLMNHVRRLCDREKPLCVNRAFPLERRVTTPIRSRAAPAPTSQVTATVVVGWEVRPTRDRASARGRCLAQAAGSLVSSSPRSQALIPCRQRLTDELRLGTLVILSWSAPQPVADDSAVARPTTVLSPSPLALQNGPPPRSRQRGRNEPNGDDLGRGICETNSGLHPFCGSCGIRGSRLRERAPVGFSLTRDDAPRLTRARWDRTAPPPSPENVKHSFQTPHPICIVEVEASPACMEQK
jgi:hypothetical protein